MNNNKAMNLQLSSKQNKYSGGMTFSSSGKLHTTDSYNVEKRKLNIYTNSNV